MAIVIGDGFVEYDRLAGTGLLHQGWKDGDDAIFHADGSIASGPIALCEVQSYVYGAWRAAAELCTALGLDDQAAEYVAKAQRLREEFARSFWCEELSTFAIALDGQKRPCRVRSSNAGQCLFTGIASDSPRASAGGDVDGPPLIFRMGNSYDRRRAKRVTTPWPTTTAAYGLTTTR